MPNPCINLQSPSHALAGSPSPPTSPVHQVSVSQSSDFQSERIPLYCLSISTAHLLTSAPDLDDMPIQSLPPPFPGSERNTLNLERSLVNPDNDVRCQTLSWFSLRSNISQLGDSYELLEVARAQKAACRARELLAVRLLAEQLLRTSIYRRKVHEARLEVEAMSMKIGTLSAHIRNRGGSIYSPPRTPRRSHRYRNTRRECNYMCINAGILTTP